MPNLLGRYSYNVISIERYFFGMKEKGGWNYLSAIYIHQINHVIAKCQTYLVDIAIMLFFKDKQFCQQASSHSHWQLNSTSVWETE